jgi:hypothetical protein
MADKVPTYEEIEKHLASVNLKDFQQGGKHFPGAAASIGDVCPVYKMVRPILLAVIAFPLIPTKIKDAIKAFMAVLDVICP